MIGTDVTVAHILSSFANVDYSLMAALENSLDLLEHMNTYDVGCQHCVNLVARIEEAGVASPEMLQVLRKLITCLPSWHGNCHVWYCRDKFGLRYQKGAGRTHGETVEHLWRETNQVGQCTREMNPGSRKDGIDDVLDEWNIVLMEDLRVYCLPFYPRMVLMTG